MNEMNGSFMALLSVKMAKTVPHKRALFQYLS